MSYDEHLITQAGGDGDEERICGETFDHDERITYKDEEVEQWECTNCGAEWYHDAEDTP